MFVFRKLIFILLFAFPILTCSAQKKEIAQAKTYLKNSSNPQKAEEILTRLLNDSINRGNMRIWSMLVEAVSKQYDQINEQLYLKQQSDTGKLFNAARRLFIICESLDSVDGKTDKKGNAEFKFRKKHAEILNSYRGNLYNGGMYFVRKHDFEQGFKLFDTYLDCIDQPLFAAYHYNTTDKRLPQAAYMATYCAFRQGDAAKTMKYAELAKQDSAKQVFLYQYLSDTYQNLGDTSKLIKSLSEGFKLRPSSMYFFPRLYDQLYKRGDFQQALSICNVALAVDSLNNVFALAKSSALLAMEQYDDCVKVCEQILERNESLSGTWYNAGLAYYNQALKIESDVRQARKQRTYLLELYKKSLPYLQRFRELTPNEQEKWAMPLYTIYLNLNMGKEFEEIDKLLKNGKAK